MITLGASLRALGSRSLSTWTGTLFSREGMIREESSIARAFGYQVPSPSRNFSSSLERATSSTAAIAPSTIAAPLSKLSEHPSTGLRRSRNPLLSSTTSTVASIGFGLTLVRTPSNSTCGNLESAFSSSLSVFGSKIPDFLLGRMWSICSSSFVTATEPRSFVNR